MMAVGSARAALGDVANGIDVGDGGGVAGVHQDLLALRVGLHPGALQVEAPCFWNPTYGPQDGVEDSRVLLAAGAVLPGDLEPAVREPRHPGGVQPLRIRVP